MQPRTNTASSQEFLLLDYASRLQRHRAGRVAYWLHLSRLQRENRHSTDIRLAANLLRPVAKAFHGEVFILRTGDVVMTLKDPVRTMVDSALFQVRYSFSKDPLIRQVDDEGDAAYLTEYAMEKEYDAFAAACRDEMARARETDRAPNGVPEAWSHASPHAAAEAAPAAAGLGPRLIVSRGQPAETAKDTGNAAALRTADITIGGVKLERSRLARRQLICTQDENGRQLAIGLRHHVPEKAIDEFGRLSLARARGQITPKDALVEIERSALPVLMPDFLSETVPISVVSLRLDTVMTAEFAGVLKALDAPAQTEMWLAIEASDVRDDPETAAYALDFLRKRGLMVGLANLNPSIAPHVVRQLAGMSFAEIVPTGDKPLPAAFVQGLLRLLDADNILVGANAEDHDALYTMGARRFIIGAV